MPKGLSTDGRNLYLNLAVSSLIFPSTTLKLPLEPLNDNTAVVRGIGRGLGEVIVAVPDRNGVRLKYSGYTLTREGTEDAALVHAAGQGSAGVESGL
jgi:hypothetical protein